MIRGVKDHHQLTSKKPLLLEAESDNHQFKEPKVHGDIPSKPRWWTGEFILYYVIFLASLCKAVSVTLGFSSESHPDYESINTRLRQGWLFGRQIDLSDYQFRSFRQYIPMAAAAMVAFALLNRLGTWIICRDRPLKGRTLRHLMYWRAALSIIGLLAFHGPAGAVKIVPICLIYFGIAKIFGGSRLNPIITWIYSLGVIFGMEKMPAIPLGSIAAFSGLYSRWWVTFNISILRLISFNLDWYFAAAQSNSQVEPALINRHYEACNECHGGADPCEKMRMTIAAPPEAFNLAAFFAYIYYVPLFMAGPIITFNNFYAQSTKRLGQLTPTSILVYGLRLGMSMFVLEAILHAFWVVAIKDTYSWTGFTALEFAMVGFWNLKIVWLKLLVIWRFFRFFAMLDGILAPENMARCMSNNYSGLAFWRAWHRSFNLWVIRYLYVPLGGSAWSAWNIWPIFSFVAVWHDIELRLLLWGWLICLFILPEILARWAAKRWKLYQMPYYRHLCALAATFNIQLMMIANLVGFAVGLEGMKIMLRGILQFNNLLFIIISCVTIYAVAHIMFEIREEEARCGCPKNF